MEVNQVSSPKRVWCHGEETGQDITILLRPSEITNKVVAELKMHSNVLNRFSRYFEVALNERWSNPNASMTFSLEMIPGLHVDCYIECFERMYQPLKKAFKSVESSLPLLRAASHIDYDKLTTDICGYLSAVRWSEGEELLIRQCASSEDFPRSQAKDLIVRLALAASDHEKLGDVVEQIIGIALGGEYSPQIMSIEEARSFFDEQFANIGQSVKNPEFYTDTMKIVNSATKELLVDFEKHCRQHNIGNIEEHYHQHELVKMAHGVPGFELGLEAICWILDKLITANVAEEAVGWFLHLELYPSIFKAAVFSYNYRHVASAIDIARLVMLMHQNAASGNLVLEESARVKLLRQWDLVKAYNDLGQYHDIMCDMAFPQAREDKMLCMSPKKQVKLILQAKESVYRTLSVEKQIELVQQGVCSGSISQRSLARLVKRKWASR